LVDYRKNMLPYALKAIEAQQKMNTVRVGNALLGVVLFIAYELIISRFRAQCFVEALSHWSGASAATHQRRHHGQDSLALVALWPSWFVGFCLLRAACSSFLPSFLILGFNVREQLRLGDQSDSKGKRFIKELDKISEYALPHLMLRAALSILYYISCPIGAISSRSA